MPEVVTATLTQDVEVTEQMDALEAGIAALFDELGVTRGIGASVLLRMFNNAVIDPRYPLPTKEEMMAIVEQSIDLHLKQSRAWQERHGDCDPYECRHERDVR